MTRGKDAKTWLRIILIVFIAVIIIGYSAFQARKIVEGPRIFINSPKSGKIYGNPLIQIKGVATNIKDISLDDRPIHIDEQGNFNESLLLFPGYNVITMKATDKFGKGVNKKIEEIFINN